ncbi:uncharacterized protein LOC128987544 [Macrosteles quadrilineatus]|uniref:uncharacterized protein LOC128987544 n=1 Tax=Macrosteles quadrilineatus TaxID=74068 RepID=UPI0023E1AC3C|nr:uncharacterized protein LOC128987544 [Macrosteles quadrilineatus]
MTTRMNIVNMKDIRASPKERKLSEAESPKSRSRTESGQFLFQEVHSEVTIAADEKDNEVSGSSSEESDEEDDEDDEDLEYESQRIATGGKWKPEGHEWMNQPTWNSAPPVGFTGGKWKPSPPSTSTSTSSVVTPSVNLTSTLISQHEETQVVDESKCQGPPPGHTRGKWLPTLDSADRRYWCGPCNRRLSSLALYDKHCLSDLHRRRTRQENMLEEDLYMDHPRPEGKREVKRSRFLDPDQGWTEGPRSKRSVQMQSPDGVPNKGRGGALQCALCRCQVLPQLMSKHLVSFYHSNRVRSAPEIAGRLAMDHMGDIVRQAPFQCGPCSFYCNTMQTFLWHWGSKTHQLKDTQIEGYYCCPICRVEVVSSAQMYQHLLSSRHKESVAIINGSVPIVMQKKRIIEVNIFAY